MDDETMKKLAALREEVHRKMEEMRVARDQLPDIYRQQQELIESISAKVEAATGKKLELALPEEVRLRTEKAIEDLAADLADPYFREDFEADMKKLQAILNEFAEFHSDEDDHKDTSDDDSRTFH
jgi:protein-tyrosine-phosphatase